MKTKMLAGFLGVLLATAAWAGNNRGVIPPQASYKGMTYAEWSAKWWQWAMAMPLEEHPLADTANCSTDQSGHVWFLGGSFTSTEVVRNCTVPVGKAIFFPILNTECSTAEPPPFYGGTEQELRDCAKGWVDGATGTYSIDGVEGQSLEPYRVQSPLFSFGPLPVNNVLFIDEGLSGDSISDGYWLMVAPLSAGQHTIDFVGTFANGFSFHITYNLTVTPRGASRKP